MGLWPTHGPQAPTVLQEPVIRITPEGSRPNPVDGIGCHCAPPWSVGMEGYETPGGYPFGRARDRLIMMAASQIIATTPMTDRGQVAS